MPLTKEDLDAVKALAKAGRIDEARSLLASIDGERAGAALIKFNERYPPKENLQSVAEVPKSKPVEKPPNYALWGGVIVAVILIGGFLAWQIPAVKFTVYGAWSRLYGACLRSTWDRYGYDSDTEGCKYSVERAMDLYKDETLFCLETSSQTDKRFDACLEEEGVIISA